ncbi:MAG: 2-amino-4-hydroxy-6-hydroxymethyldihydropteridine diphosphokinase [Prevotella sp.]
MEHKVYFSLGTNLGDKERNIGEAIDRMAQLIGNVESRSALYVTEPWGFTSPHMFVNAAVCCTTSLTPRQVLDIAKRIEREMGRRQKSVDGQYHDRIIDIDILLYDDIRVDEPDLKIPHPLMHERDFVMKPLNEIVDKKC